MNCILCENITHNKITDVILECEVCGTRFFKDYKTTAYDYGQNYFELYPGMAEDCIKIRDYPNPVARAAERGIPYAVVLKWFSYQENPASVLDVGCGYGYMAWAIHSLQLEVSGIDISEQAIDFAQKTYSLPYYCLTIDDYIKENKKHDIILSIEVLEHLANPKEFIRSCLKVAPQIVLTTPNLDHYRTNIQDFIWISDEPPVHLAIYGKKSMEYLADQLGLKVQINDQFQNLFVVFNA